MDYAQHISRQVKRLQASADDLIGLKNKERELLAFWEKSMQGVMLESGIHFVQVSPL
jgi:hypothetical protein